MTPRSLAHEALLRALCGSPCAPRYQLDTLKNVRDIVRGYIKAAACQKVASTLARVFDGGSEVSNRYGAPERNTPRTKKSHAGCSLEAKKLEAKTFHAQAD